MSRFALLLAVFFHFLLVNAIPTISLDDDYEIVDVTTDDLRDDYVMIDVTCEELLASFQPQESNRHLLFALSSLAPEERSKCWVEMARLRTGNTHLDLSLLESTAELNLKDANVLAKDLTRLGDKLGSVTDKEALANVLHTFGRFNADIGYSQGLHFIAAMLLVIMKDQNRVIQLMHYILSDIQMRHWYLNEPDETHLILRDEICKQQFPNEFFHSLPEMKSSAFIETVSFENPLISIVYPVIQKWFVDADKMDLSYSFVAVDARRNLGFNENCFDSVLQEQGILIEKWKYL